MKKLVPSTRGSLAIVLTRTQSPVSINRGFVKYADIRVIANESVSHWDMPYNRVNSIEIKFTFPMETA